MPNSAPALARERIASLDGLRGFAVLAVVVHNAGWIGQQDEQLWDKLFASAAAAGWIGVQLFFVLSGFLITGILRHDRGRPAYFRRFFIRRTLRIFPLYYATLALVAAAALWLGREHVWAARTLREQGPYWLYVSNWTEPFREGIEMLSHMWSLAVEEQFYLLWPVLVWALSRERLARLTLALVCSGPLLRLLMHMLALPHEALYTFTVARMDALATGACLALLLEQEGPRALVARYAMPVTLGAAALLAALAVVQRGLHAHELPVIVAGQSLVSVLSACAIAWGVGAVPIRLPSLRRITEQGVLPNLGKYSYAMYVVHYPLHRALDKVFSPWVNAPGSALHLPRVLLYVSVVLGLSYLLARVSWLVLEGPCLRWRNRWTSARDVERPAGSLAMPSL